MSRLTATPGQTIGPFHGYAVPYLRDSELVPVGDPDAVQLTGRVLDGGDAPVHDALVFARGLLNRLFTRAYVPVHRASGTDSLLASLDHDARQGLVAEQTGRRLTFDNRLQGPRETTFLRYPGHSSQER